MQETRGVSFYVAGQGREVYLCDARSTVGESGGRNGHGSAADPVAATRSAASGGGEAMRWMLQNLNENRVGQVVGSVFFHGRAWLYWGSGARSGLRIEWCLFRHSRLCGVDFSVLGEETDFGWSVRIPWLVGIYFSCSLPFAWLPRSPDRWPNSWIPTAGRAYTWRSSWSSTDAMGASIRQPWSLGRSGIMPSYRMHRRRRSTDP